MSDLGDIFEIFSDSESMRFYPGIYSLEECRSLIAKQIKSQQKNGFSLWAVELKDHTFIGDCGITLQSIDSELVPEIGYHIHKNYCRNGYATEAAKAVMKYGFNEFGFEKLYIHTYVKNLPSRAVALKLQMTQTKEYDKFIKDHNLVMRHVVFEKARVAG